MAARERTERRPSPRLDRIASEIHCHVRQIEGLDDAAAEEYFNQQIAGRLSFTNMINGLAVPWGLMPLFIAKTLVNTALFVVPIVQGSYCQVFLKCFRQTDSPFWPERDLDEQA